MIDHTGINVSNFEVSREFYAAALAPLEYELLHEFDASVTGFGSAASFGEAGKPDFWIGEGEVNTPRIHVAFRLRPQYHPDYYGAFVLDPDGHNIEAVCHTPA